MKIFKNILKVFIIIICCQNDIRSQNLICFTCNKKIESEYLVVGNKHFHPEHFVCGYCKKKLPETFISENNIFYHDECYTQLKGLTCDYCKKIIKDEYIVYQSKKFHKDCYQEVLPKCNICEKSLTGTFSVDFYGNQYHSFHEKEYLRCTSCNRLITNLLTNGGKDYTDGRSICNICYPEAIFDVVRISGLLEKVRIKLNSFGISTSSGNIKIKGVNLIELKKVSGNSFSKSVKGFCETTSERIGLSKAKYTHTIYVLNGLPSSRIEGIIAHELMHVWINQNTSRKQSNKIIEGSCNYIAYLYLLEQNQSLSVKQLISEIENDPSSLYGDGFRVIKDMFHKKGVLQLLKYLKETKSSH